MANRYLVLSSHDDLTEDIRYKLTKYYEENDHRPINNNSYSRYPMWCDFDDPDCDTVDDILVMLKDKELITEDDYCVIIHWEW